MAVVKYSALLDELRGKLNGTVFSKFHNGYNSYKKGQPKRFGSQAQQLQRQSLSIAAKYWKNASQLLRDRYSAKAAVYPVRNRFGELVNLPSFQYYMLISRLRQITGLNIESVPGSNTPSVNSYEVLPSSDLTITATDTGHILSGIIDFNTLSAYPDSASISIYVSSAVPSTDVTQRRTHYYVMRQARTGGLSIGTKFSYTVSDLLLPSGFRPVSGGQLEIKLVFWISGQAAIIPPAFFRVPFTYIPPAPPEWPITWAFSGNDGRFTELQNAGGTWQPQGTGTWLASPSENLAGVAADYEFELAMSPNLFSSDIARPEEFDDPRPTLSGTLAAKSSFAPYYITPATIGDLQAWMRSNFSYTSGDGYKYQPTAIRIKNPTSGAWSNWGYSNIWLPIF